MMTMSVIQLSAQKHFSNGFLKDVDKPWPILHHFATEATER
jgi:hypothetical protein